MKKGFTLIEIILVIAVGVILLAVGALSLTGLRSARTLETETQQLVAVLQASQEKAAGQDMGSRWGVYFDITAERNAYFLFQVDEDLQATPEYGDIPGAILDSHTLSPGLTLVLENGVTSSLIFAKGTGRPTAAATITVTSGSEETAKNVIITAQGRISYE